MTSVNWPCNSPSPSFPGRVETVGLPTPGRPRSAPVRRRKAAFSRLTLGLRATADPGDCRQRRASKAARRERTFGRTNTTRTERIAFGSRGGSKHRAAKRGADEPPRVDGEVGRAPDEWVGERRRYHRPRSGSSRWAVLRPMELTVRRTATCSWMRPFRERPRSAGPAHRTSWCSRREVSGWFALSWGTNTVDPDRTPRA